MKQNIAKKSYNINNDIDQMICNNPKNDKLFNKIFIFLV
jgi:hypothetical protein